MCWGTFALANNCSHFYPIIVCVPVKVKVKVFSAKISQKSPVCFAFGKAQFFVASFISSACAGVLLHLWLLPAPLPHRLPLLHHDPQTSHSGDDSGLQKRMFRKQNFRQEKGFFLLLYIQKVHFKWFHNLHKVIVKKKITICLNNKRISPGPSLDEQPGSIGKQETSGEKRKQNLGKINFQTLCPRWRENIWLGTRFKRQLRILRTGPPLNNLWNVTKQKEKK